jgi:hypothetical protein
MTTITWKFNCYENLSELTDNQANHSSAAQSFLFLTTQKSSTITYNKFSGYFSLSLLMHPRAAITSTRKTKMNGTFSWFNFNCHIIYDSWRAS